MPEPDKASSFARRDVTLLCFISLLLCVLLIDDRSNAIGKDLNSDAWFDGRFSTVASVYIEWIATSVILCDVTNAIHFE